VFGTGIGPDYRKGGLLYVGKSPGQRGHEVGSNYDQSASIAASTDWMIEERNKSPFWQFARQFDHTRRTIAWTNVCKMDQKGGEKPPAGSAWACIADISIAALMDEMAALAPKMAVFAISDRYRSNVWAMLTGLGFAKVRSPCDSDGWTTVFKTIDGTYAVTTRHPQGWKNSFRDPVVALVKRLMAGA
jgi:hypothetical protein